jgi:single-strand DNA-binding protein
MYLNEIKLIGFVGQDAELKGSQNRKELVRLDLATKASWKHQESGKYDSRTEWHHIVVWGGLARFAQTLKKGEHIYVSGELRYRQYEKELRKGEDTVKMSVAEIHANEIRRLDAKASEDGAAT